MEDELQEILDSLGYEDWTVESESTLVSPKGYTIEWDGVSPEGEVSPLREMGMI